MSEVNKTTGKDEYIEINLSKMFMGFFVAIYKNIKVFLMVFVLGCILTVGFTIFVGGPSYAYKQMIQTPSYFDGKTEKNILSDTRINIILQSKLKQLQEKSPDNALLQQVQILTPFYSYEIGSGDKDRKIIKDSNFNLKQAYDQQTTFFTIFMSSKKSDSAEVSKLYDNLLQQFSESIIIQKEINLWKRSLDTQLKLTTENLTRNEELLKRNQQYLMELISKQTNILGMDSQSQSMILKYIGSIDSYQNKIFSLQDSIAVKKLELENVEAKLSGFGDNYSVTAKSDSSMKVVLVGLLLSLLVSILLSLIGALFRKVAEEAKKN